MKALEKDRTRRYDTAIALAEDLRRHLSDQPVLAGPPGAFYRMRKFVHRNRTVVLAVSVVLAALITGLAVATVGFVRARSETARSEAISATLMDLFRSFDPTVAAESGVDVRAVVERARGVFGSSHATVAATLNTLAGGLHDAGDFESAEPLFP